MPANTLDTNDTTVHFHYAPHEEDSNDDSSCNEVIRLNKKWLYNLDMEQFLRRLPKVSAVILSNVCCLHAPVNEFSTSTVGSRGSNMEVGY
jgi:hypothetical protein